VLLLLYYFNNIALQVSPTYKSKRRFSLIKRYVPCNMILMDFNFFSQFFIMWKLGKCEKYIRSLAIPLWTSFTVLETMEVSHKFANPFPFNTCTMQADYNISKLFTFQWMKLKAPPTTDIQYHRIHTILRLLMVSLSIIFYLEMIPEISVKHVI
jgi:hypothetical protein